MRRRCGLLLVLLLALGIGRPGWARPLTQTQKEESAARRQAEQGVKDLESGRLPQAQQELERAYAKAPLPEILFQLGRVAEQQHDEVAAADLYRRYLATLGDGEAKELHALRDRLKELLSRVRQQATELDVLSEDLGGLFSVDKHVIGVLPLSAPLLTAAGQHRFKIDKGQQQFESNPLTIPSGQHVQLQLAVASRYAVLSLSSGIVLLFDPADTPDAVKAPLEKAIAAVAPESSSFLIEPESTGAALGKMTPEERSGCAQNLDCQERLARGLDAAFVLRLTLLPGASAPAQLMAQLFDVATGVLAGSAAVETSLAAPEPLPQLTAKLVGDLLKALFYRGRGTLQVTSTPAGARVLAFGRELGRTPFSREAFEGGLSLGLELSGYEPYKAEVQIKRGELTAITASLNQPVPEVVEPPPALLLPPPPSLSPAVPHRPRWRLLAGGAGVAAGLVVGGFGVSALAAVGQCIEPAAPGAQVCDYTFSTRAVGGGLLGTGIALTAGGVILLAWPPSPIRSVR